MEFALIAPMLFLLLFGVIQIGLLMASQNGLVNGVRDTARRAATYRINQDSFGDGSAFAAICGTVEANLSTHLGQAIPGFVAANLHRTISYEWRQNPDNSYFLIATVDATYDNPMLLPLDPLVRLLGLASTGNFEPGTFPLSASEQMRVENPTLTPSAPTTETCAP
ncbi:MAG TPA: TadE/TadG family type IV pilus assembly protein [Candidatus Limnocylindrales bacterium]